MSKRCKGCGVTLQYTDKGKIGYTPKEDADYCQRCFRIRHYDDVTISMKTGIDPNLVLRQIAELDAMVLWVVDLFDFEANMIHGLHRHLSGKPLIMVGTKRDLLPDTLSNEKLSRFIFERCHELGIPIDGLVICGDLVNNAHNEHNGSLDEVRKAISLYRDQRDVVVMGMANAGKSTLLNALLERDELTTSRYPGTTLESVKTDMGDYTLYDTPGLTRDDSCLTLADDSGLKQLIPMQRLKARNYQLYEDQSLAVGGLVRLDLIGGKKVSCVNYFAATLNLHRGKLEKADALWDNHWGELLSPTLTKNKQTMRKYTHLGCGDKLDVVIHGLGWFCISGDVKVIHVYVPQGVGVTFRKAMI